jgi:uncharacterized protein (TIGR03435 family)
VTIFKPAFDRACGVAALFLASTTVPFTTHAQQTNPATTAAPALAFDVVSIRPNSTPNWRIQNTPDGFRIIGLPLGTALIYAYFPPGLQSRDWIIDAPEWLWNDTYDFDGKVSAEDQPEWSKRREARALVTQNNSLTAMLQPMLQAALADRCKLVVHRVPGETQGYALMLAKKDPNLKALKPAEADEIVPSNALPIMGGGKMVPIKSNEDPVLTFYQTSMAAFGAMLPFGRPVPILDRTGLTGKYDFKLLRLGIAPEINGDWDLAALGLKLVPIKVPIEKIVIDHIEKPTPN